MSGWEWWVSGCTPLPTLPLGERGPEMEEFDTPKVLLQVFKAVQVFKLNT